MTVRGTVIWVLLAIIVAVPLANAASSPLLQWREPAYIIGGLSGAIGLILILLQPLLIAGVLPGAHSTRWHVWGGAGLVIAVSVHVGALWITSPPDVVDVLLFRSPTPFAVWGAIAMWAVFAAAFLFLVKRRVAVRIWRLLHSFLVIMVAIGTIVHAWLILGTMGYYSKAIVCILVVVATSLALRRRRVWRAIPWRRKYQAR